MNPVGTSGRRALRLSGDEVDRLLEQVLEYLVPIDQPLVLISQIQRSGGTLLSQLLDGHHGLHVHPGELQIGKPKRTWPELALTNDPERLLELLNERQHVRFFAAGYRRRMPEHEQYQEEVLPFMLPPSLLGSLFRAVMPAEVASSRTILDTYFTAYFNAWLDNHHLRDGPKRWIVAFTPRLGWGESRDRFFTDYPDGRLIAIVREPKDWYASWRAHHPRYGDYEREIEEWLHGIDEIVAAVRQRPEATLVLRFDDLLQDTEQVMRGLMRWLGIAFSESLRQPTFNDMPIRANSSFAVSEHGVLVDPLGRGVALTEAAARHIETVARERYEHAIELAWRPACGA